MLPTLSGGYVLGLVEYRPMLLAGADQPTSARAERRKTPPGAAPERATPRPEQRQRFGVIFPANVCVTIFPSFTTNVSVPSS